MQMRVLIRTMWGDSFVHAECESVECAKAYADLSPEHLRAFLESHL